MLRHRFSPRRLAAAQCLLWALAAAPAGACSYHGLIGDSFSASYPGSIDVAMALRSALDRNQLRHAPAAPALLGLARTTRWLENFGQWTAQASPEALPDFAVLLVEPGLWTRYRKGATGMVMEPHVAGPTGSEVVLITGEAALWALVERRLSMTAALKTGVVRVEGNPDAVARLLPRLDAAFAELAGRSVTAAR